MMGRPSNSFVSRRLRVEVFHFMQAFNDTAAFRLVRAFETVGVLHFAWLTDAGVMVR